MHTRSMHACMHVKSKWVGQAKRERGWSPRTNPMRSPRNFPTPPRPRSAVHAARYPFPLARLAHTLSPRARAQQARQAPVAFRVPVPSGLPAAPAARTTRPARGGRPTRAPRPTPRARLRPALLILSLFGRLTTVTNATTTRPERAGAVIACRRVLCPTEMKTKSAHGRSVLEACIIDHTRLEINHIGAPTTTTTVRRGRLTEDYWTSSTLHHHHRTQATWTPSGLNLM